jgi:hypothetical protein
VTLCGFHHGLVHEGGFGVRATDDGALIFTRPDGSRIRECGSPAAPPAHGRESFRGNFGDAGLDAFEDSLRSHLRSLDPTLEIDAQTSRCKWLGERMDYSLAIEGLQCLRDKAAHTYSTSSQ